MPLKFSSQKPYGHFQSVNSVEEDEAAHVELNDSKIIQMVQEDEEEEEQEEEQVEFVETSKEEKLNFLAVNASILD